MYEAIKLVINLVDFFFLFFRFFLFIFSDLAGAFITATEVLACLAPLPLDHRSATVA